MIEVTCPLYVDLERKTKKDKRVYLNLNTYRNLNHFSSNQAKVMIKEIIQAQLVVSEPLSGHISVSLDFYAPDCRKRDLGNVCTIVEKFVSDALVECQLIEDDNTDNIIQIKFNFAGIDKNNPRVECKYEAIA